MVSPSIQQIAASLFWKLISDTYVRQQLYQAGVGILDFIQVATGNVNIHSPENAVEIAINTCLRKDRVSQIKVAAFVTALYLQYDIERAAQVGGSLLKRFGKSWFPHIKDRELRFALEVDSELENYLYNQILGGKDGII
jgi:hypothetical protein